MRVVPMVVAVVFGAQAASAGIGSTTPFTTTAQGGIVVKARLNGLGPFNLLVDTGSSHSAITAALARTTGSTPAGHTTVASPAGEEVRSIVRLDRLEIGSEPAFGVLASVIPSLPASIDGIIGQDVLAQRRYTIDFAARRVEWHRSVSPVSASASRFPLEFDEGRPVVSLPQPAFVLRLVPDSGAAGLVLFGPAARALPEQTAPLRSRALITLIGQRAARQISLRELHVGRLTLRDVDAVILDNAGATGCDGLLPLRYFERVTFDGPGKSLVLVSRNRNLG